MHQLTFAGTSATDASAISRANGLLHCLCLYFRHTIPATARALKKEKKKKKKSWARVLQELQVQGTGPGGLKKRELIATASTC